MCGLAFGENKIHFSLKFHWVSLKLRPKKNRQQTLGKLRIIRVRSIAVKITCFNVNRINFKNIFISGVKIKVFKGSTTFKRPLNFCYLLCSKYNVHTDLLSQTERLAIPEDLS